MFLINFYDRLSNLYMVIKKRVEQLKCLEICIFIVFGGSLLTSDKEKWYYMYIEHFLKTDAFFIFRHKFVTLISNLVLI